jgi:hypothetical protein
LQRPFGASNKGAVDFRNSPRKKKTLSPQRSAVEWYQPVLEALGSSPNHREEAQISSRKLTLPSLIADRNA